MAEPESPDTIPEQPKPFRGNLTHNMRRFARFYAAGDNQAQSYRKGYGHPTMTTANASNEGYRLLKRPDVRALVEDLQRRADSSTLLSMNERLAILGKGARIRGNSPAYLNAKARCIEVYTKIAGDHAPDRQEVVIKNAPGEELRVTSRPATKAEKIAALRAARAARMVAA